jgi:hypothetical protein
MRRSSSLAPTLLVRVFTPALVLALGLLGACGGKALGPGGSGGSAGSGGTGGSGGPGGSGGSGGAYNEPDGSACVIIDLSSYDQSCNQASDCIAVVGGGQICDGYCNCDEGAINASAQATYDSALSQVTPSTTVCACPESGSIACQDHVCTLCITDADGQCIDVTAPDAGGPMDAGNPDGGQCVDIVLSTYDQSCTTTSDCIGITSGKICDGSCACGGSTINESGESRYNEAISGLVLEDCPCIDDGVPTCVHGTCTMCTFSDAAPGCPDGG